MNIDRYVTSLELSKKLKEVGVRQDSIWYWVHPFMKDSFKEDKSVFIISDKPNIHVGGGISALTVGEILHVIPKIIERSPDMKDWYYFTLFCDHCIWWCFGMRSTITQKDLFWSNTDDPNLSNGLAEMLLHLIENKIITVESINERIGK